jgi:hypothetical protein
MPLLRLLFVLVPIARRLLRNPAVRARLGLDKSGTAKSGRGGSTGRGRSPGRKR